MDKDRVDAERKVLKARWEEAKAKAEKEKSPVPRLAEMTIPDDILLVVSDAGHGMKRQDLADKFLVAGRRRRGRDNHDPVQQAAEC